MQKIDTTQITNWKVATKTSAIKARPLNDVVDTKSIVFNKLLLNTLEGNEPLREDAMICIGAAGDVWMQDKNKLEKKYDAVDKDINGWVEYRPKPDNAVDVVEVTQGMTNIEGYRGINLNFYIIGQWGETVGDEKNVQRGVAGDFICRNQTDHTDVWIVKRKLFLNTYIIKT